MKSVTEKSLKHWLVALLMGSVLLASQVFDALAQDAATGWTPPVNLSEVPELISDSPVLLCDQYENLHVIWMERSDERTYFYYRRLSGMVWTPPNSILVADSNWFLDAVIAPDDTLHLIWFTLDGRVEYSSSPLFSAGDARSWTVPLTLADSIGAQRNVHGGGNSLAVDRDNRLHVIYSIPDDRAAMAHTLHYIHSSDGGQSWSTPIAVFSTRAEVPISLFGGIQVDGAGRLHVVWEERSIEYGLYSQIGYLRSRDGGQSWDNPTVIGHSEVSPGVAMPGIFVAGENEIHITWDIPDRLHQWSLDGGETWSQPTMIMPLGAAFGGFNQLAWDNAGNLHVVSAEGSGVFHAIWGGSAWNVQETIEARHLDPHQQQLEVCEGNRLHVVYADRLGGNEIWYSSRKIDATHLASLTIPTPYPDFSVTHVAGQVTDESMTNTLDAASEPVPYSLARSRHSTGISSPIAAATLTALVIAAAAWRARSRSS